MTRYAVYMRLSPRHSWELQATAYGNQERAEALAHHGLHKAHQYGQTAAQVLMLTGDDFPDKARKLPGDPITTPDMSKVPATWS